MKLLLLPCLIWNLVGVSVLAPEPAAVRGLFGAIAADRHAAPSSRAPARVISKHQGTALSLACLHVGKIFATHELRQCFADRQK